MHSRPAKRKRGLFEDFNYLSEGVILSSKDASNRKYWVPIEAVQSWEALTRIARECFEEPGQMIVFWGGVEVPMGAWQFCLKDGAEFQITFAKELFLHVAFRRSRREALELTVPTSLAVWKLRRRILNCLRGEGPVDADCLSLVANLPDLDVDMENLYNIGHYLFEEEGRQLFITAAWK
ncbi:MAG: hypothetical protein M1812_001170 [Candelaria pacifica]|nr:MAG: hypothetical protein M1812_001170 [Candelaria pacifica]